METTLPLQHPLTLIHLRHDMPIDSEHTSLGYSSEGTWPTKSSVGLQNVAVPSPLAAHESSRRAAQHPRGNNTQGDLLATPRLLLYEIR